ncbi:cytochrome C [bacterium]|nr:cytochrome C [bacterium]
MKRKTVIILTLFAIVFGSMALVAIANGGAPDVITIDKAQATKAPVVFPHKAHSDVNDCVVCHHTATGKDDAKSCFECHGKDPKANDPSVSSAKENPFHIRCKGCHNEQKKGPTKCGECHKK